MKILLCLKKPAFSCPFRAVSICTLPSATKGNTLVRTPKGLIWSGRGVQTKDPFDLVPLFLRFKNYHLLAEATNLDAHEWKARQNQGVNEISDAHKPAWGGSAILQDQRRWSPLLQEKRDTRILTNGNHLWILKIFGGQTKKEIEMKRERKRNKRINQLPVRNTASINLNEKFSVSKHTAVSIIIIIT